MTEVGAVSESEIKIISPPQKNQETPDAILPNERQTKISDWKRFIRRNIPDFKGDINSAAKLMFAYQKGSDYIYNKFSPRFGEFERPDIMILVNESKVGPSPFGAIGESNKIYVKKSFLEMNSDFETNSWSSIKTQNGELCFEGRPKDVFEVTGVEETDHRLFMQIKGVQKTEPPTSLPLAQYDAQEIEFRALRWQLQYAVENQLPEQSI